MTHYPTSPGLELQRELVKNHVQSTGINLNTNPARCNICGFGRTNKKHTAACAKENQRRRLEGKL